MRPRVRVDLHHILVVAGTVGQAFESISLEADISFEGPPLLTLAHDAALANDAGAGRSGG